MIPEDIAQGVLALLSGGTVAAVLAWLSSRKRLPIERESANAAASREITQAATELIAPLRAEVERLDREVQEARREAQDAQREALEAQRQAQGAQREADALRKITMDADDYIADLFAHWPTHRQQDRPPPWRWMDDPHGS